jgi:(p)ppGpp synthase/HD superfamily hydrolase
MQINETKKWSDEIVQAISHAHLAHAAHGNSPQDAVRFHDHLTPYLVHPIWCAASLLQEATLPLDLRKTGYIALLWHDVLEDTTLKLPIGTSSEIVKLVEEMSFMSFDEERAELWSRSPEIKLFKLYDKVSNLLDANWMKVDKWNVYVEHTLRLANEIEQKFGSLNIVKIARAIALKK